MGPQSSSQIDASGLGLGKTDPHARAASLAQLVLASQPSPRPCSLHDDPARNLACSLSNASTSFCSLFNNTLQKTFPGTDSRVIPLQLLQSLRHPFFGNGTMTPCLHSFGTSSVCHIVLSNWVNSFTTASPPYCSNSAGIPPNPAALFFSAC